MLGLSQYSSCPRLPEPAEQLYAYRSSLDGSETATDESSSSGGGDDRLHVTEQERLQVETFFKGLKTQVFVCPSLANLYLGSTAHDGRWELSHAGIPVVILDDGETRSRRRRRIMVVLAERGTCFSLWQDTIDNLSSYREAGHAFHTMHLSGDHGRLAGFSFDSPAAARDMWEHIRRLTADPENIGLSVPGRRKPRARPKPRPLPAKTHISLPCCFQHITSVEPGDHERYFSLKSLVPMPPNVQEQPATEL